VSDVKARAGACYLRALVERENDRRVDEAGHHRGRLAAWPAPGQVEPGDRVERRRAPHRARRARDAGTDQRRRGDRRRRRRLDRLRTTRRRRGRARRSPCTDHTRTSGVNWLAGWKFTSLFGTNTAISETIQRQLVNQPVNADLRVFGMLRSPPPQTSTHN